MREASAKLLEGAIPVVLCEAKLKDGNWKDLLPLIAKAPESCRLIVMSDVRTNAFGPRCSI